MDRLLKPSFWTCFRIRSSSSDRLMDRLLKQLNSVLPLFIKVRVTVWWIDYWNISASGSTVSYTVRVTVWWIDYWNSLYASVKASLFVRVTVWWIDYWNKFHLLLHTKIQGSSDRLMDRLLKQRNADSFHLLLVRVTVWWIDYWNSLDWK